MLAAMISTPHAARAADPFPIASHDHTSCVRDALVQAEAVCSQRGLRLTELRRRVLETVWESHAPVGAYEIMERLADERGRVAPPTVYRTLEFLSREGLVHRIDSLNAFVGCRAPEALHRAFFLICRSCRNAVEIHDRTVETALDRVAADAGFALERATVELAGVCAHCRDRG
jgi:Fur family transcriptional regulator, zinc uptake regulator